LTRSRKRRAEAERPSRPGNRSLWFVTAERVRDGHSSEGDDMASITRRSRDISAYYTQSEHKSTVDAAGQTVPITVVGATRADGFCHAYSGLSACDCPK
jgi:hypothetical protein